MKKKYSKKSFLLNTNLTTIIKGNPRHDKMRKLSNDRNLANTLYKTNKKKVILYAPTWRDYPMKPLQNLFDLDRWRKSLSNTHVFWVREHIITQKENPLECIVDDNFIFDMGSLPELFDLLPYVDILISDYSGMFFDFAFYERPMFCLAYDKDTYADQRGLYCDLDSLFGNRLFKNSDKLLDELTMCVDNNYCHHSSHIKKRYLYDEGDAGIRVVDALKNKLRCFDDAK